VETIFEKEEHGMEEKVYKTMGGAGALNIVLGVLMVVVGVSSGVLLLISGFKLINRRSNLTF
jgi:hypothetical protein